MSFKNQWDTPEGSLVTEVSMATPPEPYDYFAVICTAMRENGALVETVGFLTLDQADALARELSRRVTDEKVRRAELERGVKGK